MDHLSPEEDACPVLNLDEVALTPLAGDGRFGARAAPVAAPLGGRMLGARLILLDAGKAAFPFHGHHANEEMFVILDGEGTLRLGERRHPLRAGDVALCPADGARSAHQIIAGAAGIRYLAISTMIAPEVLVYPDSGKVGAIAGSPPGGAKERRALELYLRAADAVSYWDGES